MRPADEIQGVAQVQPQERWQLVAAYQQEQAQHQQGRGHSPLVPARVVKADDEGQQVQAQGGDPQPGLGGNVVADMVGGGNEGERCQRGQSHPQCAPHPTGGGAGVLSIKAWVVGGVDHRRGRSCQAQVEPHRGRTQARKRPKTPGPQPAYVLHCEKGLEQIGKRQQRKQRPGVGQGIKTKGRARGVRAGIPVLNQRAGGGQEEIRQPHTQGEQGYDFGHRLLVALGLERGLRNDEGRRHRRQGQQRQMDNGLPARRAAAADQEGIKIPAAQRALEKQHGRGPHRGTAAKPGQDEFADQRLNLEEQKSAEQNGQRIAKLTKGLQIHLRRLVDQWLRAAGSRQADPSKCA